MHTEKCCEHMLMCCLFMELFPCCYLDSAVFIRGLKPADFQEETMEDLGLLPQKSILNSFLWSPCSGGIINYEDLLFFFHHL